MRGHSAASRRTDDSPVDVPTVAVDQAPACSADGPVVSFPGQAWEEGGCFPRQDWDGPVADDCSRRPQDSGAPAVSAALLDSDDPDSDGYRFLLQEAPDDSLPANHRQVPDASADSAEPPHSPRKRDRVHTGAIRSFETASILPMTENTVTRA
jgi:hypothetical protein